MEVYGMPQSSPCRIVTLALDYFGLDYEYKTTNLFAGEGRTPEFLKMNPQHNIPVFNDNGFIMNESRAILCYIANAYAKDDSVYPKDPKVRARVDQALNFDSAAFYKSLIDVFIPFFKGEYKTKSDIKQDKLERMKEVLGWAEDMVAEGYFVGSSFTIADIALLASFTSIKEAQVVDTSCYKNLNAWYERVKKHFPNYEKANGEGVRIFGEFVKTKTGS